MSKTSISTYAIAIILAPFALLAAQKLFLVVAMALDFL